jgi:hypothetical protein
MWQWSPVARKLAEVNSFWTCATLLRTNSNVIRRNSRCWSPTDERFLICRQLVPSSSGSKKVRNVSDNHGESEPHRVHIVSFLDPLQARR